MDYSSIITGLVAITTAFFGFSQYYYSRIIDKASILLDTIRENQNKLKDFQPNSIQIQGTLLRLRYEGLQIKVEKNKINLVNHTQSINNDSKSEDLLKIINRLPPVYVVFLILYGATAAIIQFDTSDNSILKHGIPIFLYIIMTTLSFYIFKVYGIVKDINFNQREIKKDLSKISSAFDDDVHARKILIEESSVEQIQKYRDNNTNENISSEMKNEEMFNYFNVFKNLSEEDFNAVIQLIRHNPKED